MVRLAAVRFAACVQLGGMRRTLGSIALGGSCSVCGRSRRCVSSACAKPARARLCACVVCRTLSVTVSGRDVVAGTTPGRIWRGLCEYTPFGFAHPSVQLSVRGLPCRRICMLEYVNCSEIAVKNAKNVPPLDGGLRRRLRRAKNLIYKKHIQSWQLLGAGPRGGSR